VETATFLRKRNSSFD